MPWKHEDQPDILPKVKCFWNENVNVSSLSVVIKQDDSHTQHELNYV